MKAVTRYGKRDVRVDVPDPGRERVVVPLGNTLRLPVPGCTTLAEARLAWA